MALREKAGSAEDRSMPPCERMNTHGAKKRREDSQDENESIPAHLESTASLIRYNNGGRSSTSRRRRCSLFSQVAQHPATAVAAAAAIVAAVGAILDAPSLLLATARIHTYARTLGSSACAWNCSRSISRRRDTSISSKSLRAYVMGSLGLQGKAAQGRYKGKQAKQSKRDKQQDKNKK